MTEYVLKRSDGYREYFKSYRAAVKRRHEMVKAGQGNYPRPYTPDQLVIINVERQRMSAGSVKKAAKWVRRPWSSFSNSELAAMVIGVGSEASADAFGRYGPFPTAIRKAAQRRLKEYYRAGKVHPKDEFVMRAIRHRIRTPVSRKKKVERWSKAPSGWLKRHVGKAIRGGKRPRRRC